MPNAIVTALLIAVGIVMLGAAYLLGYNDGRFNGKWDERLEAGEDRVELVQKHIQQREELWWEAHFAKRRAFERAASAVTLWEHRINKRADLARHIESLATAPELGAATPNPEREPQEEPRPHDTADSPSRVPSAAPVLAATVGADEDLGVESGNEGRIDPMEGFL